MVGAGRSATGAAGGDLTERRIGAGGVVRSKATARKDSDELEEKLRRLEFQYELTRSRAELARTSDSAEVRLRRDRIELPDLTAHQRSYELRQGTISDVQVALFDLDYELSSLAPNIEREPEILAKIPADLRDTVAGEVRQLLADQRIAYTDLVKDYNEYLTWLVGAQLIEQRIIETGSSFVQFIDDRILWIRSASPIAPGDIALSAERLKEIFSPTGWSEVISDLWRDARNYPLGYCLFVLIIIALVLSRGWLKRRLEAFATLAERPFVGHIGHTLVAIVITIGLSVTVPLLLWFLAWRLQAIPETAVIVDVVAAGLERTARAILFATVLWEICRPKGLAQSHFGWRDETRHVFRSNIAWPPRSSPAATPAAARWDAWRS
jgi:potassium efflux system protein